MNYLLALPGKEDLKIKLILELDVDVIDRTDLKVW